MALPDFATVNGALSAGGSLVEAAECHGVLCGILCTSGSTDMQGWVGHLFATRDESADISADSLRILHDVQQGTLAGINHTTLEFSLLLPESVEITEEDESSDTSRSEEVFSQTSVREEDVSDVVVVVVVVVVNEEEEVAPFACAISSSSLFEAGETGRVPTPAAAASQFALAAASLLTTTTEAVDSRVFMIFRRE